MQLLKKVKFVKQKHEVGYLPAVVATHSDPFNLLIGVTSNNKITLVNKVIEIK